MVALAEETFIEFEELGALVMQRLIDATCHDLQSSFFTHPYMQNMPDTEPTASPSPKIFSADLMDAQKRHVKPA